MDIQQLIGLAKELKWRVWAYRVDVKDVLNQVVGDKVVYILRSPTHIPFADGRPVAHVEVKQAPDKDDVIDQLVQAYTTPSRETEFEAWQDLPLTVHDLYYYSRLER